MKEEHILFVVFEIINMVNGASKWDFFLPPWKCSPVYYALDNYVRHPIFWNFLRNDVVRFLLPVYQTVLSWLIFREYIEKIFVFSKKLD